MIYKKEEAIDWESPFLIHPGEHLKDFLENDGITQVELAKRIGISKKAINEIIKGKNPVTRSTAFRLSKVFSVSPEFWINLQSNYDSLLAKKEEERRIENDKEKNIEKYRETYKELANLGVLEKLRWTKSNLSIITKNLQYFFKVDSLCYVESKVMCQVFFRKYERDNFNRYKLFAWVQLGRTKAKKKTVNSFDKEKLKSRLEKIRSLSVENSKTYVPEIEKILAECGIVFVCAPSMKNTYVQGLTEWIDSDKVLLMLNTTNKNEGKFWFNLFHELGHILLHGKRDIYISFDDDEMTKKEKEADNFAEKMLVGNFSDFYDFKKANNLDNQIAVRLFSRKKKISPAIVAGIFTHKHKKEGDIIYRSMDVFLKDRINYYNYEIVE